MIFSLLIFILSCIIIYYLLDYINKLEKQIKSLERFIDYLQEQLLLNTVERDIVVHGKCIYDEPAEPNSLGIPLIQSEHVPDGISLLINNPFMQPMVVEPKGILKLTNIAEDKMSPNIRSMYNRSFVKEVSKNV